MAEVSALDNARAIVKKACEILDLDEEVYKLLENPERLMEFSIPVKMDDGSLKIFQGYRSQHNTALGPSLGGIRFRPDVTRDEVTALSIWMTFKNSLGGMPFGGGKAGVIVEPHDLSEGEKERLSRGFVQRVYPLSDPHADLYGPDMGTDIQTMTWMVDEYIKLSGKAEVGAYLRKPVGLHGSLGGQESTGIGMANVAKKIMDLRGRSIEGARIGIHGFGNVGSSTSKHITRLGAKVVAVSNHSFDHGVYNIYNEEGFDFEDLEALMEKEGHLLNAPGAKKISDEEFWSLDLDIMVPAVNDNTVDVDQAKLIKADVILEGANGPTTEAADKILQDKNVLVVPDILANSGGATIAYLEWVQNNYGYYWDEETVVDNQKKMMIKAVNEVWKIKEEYDTSMRMAAYMYSVKRVADAMKLRGWY